MVGRFLSGALLALIATAAFAQVSPGGSVGPGPLPAAPAGSTLQFQYNNAGAFGGSNTYETDANTVEQYNSAAAQSLNIYNTRTDASNYERGLAGWCATNVFCVGTQKAGTGSARNIEFVVGGTNQLDFGVSSAGAWATGASMYTNGFFRGSPGAVTAAIGINASNIMSVNATGLFAFGSGSTLGGLDTGLSRDSAGVIDVGNGTAANTSGSMKMSGITLTGITTNTGGQIVCVTAGGLLYKTSTVC